MSSVPRKMVNEGVTFGLWQGIPVGVVGVVWLVLFYVALKMRELWERIGTIMILMGGGMNMYDRLRYGGVVDNLNFANVLYNNVWDYLIVAGLLIYGYSYFVRRRRTGGDR